MADKYGISIITPTYNRLDTIKKLYSSLCNQTLFDFEWIVIDDGSTDGTDLYFNKLKSDNFNIIYFKQRNGGKHRALNTSHQFIHFPIVGIVDSDDYLTPDAVETITSEWKIYENDSSICGMSYMRGKTDGSYYSSKHKDDVYIDDDIHYRVNQGVSGDRFEILRTELLKAYRFPEYAGEKFMSEGWLWTNLAKKYKTVYRNKILYMCEYLPGGLSKTGRPIRIKCPKGMLDNCRAYMDRRVKLTRRIKACLLFGTYARFDDQSIKFYLDETKAMIPWNILIYPSTIILYHIWKMKYCQD